MSSGNGAALVERLAAEGIRSVDFRFTDMVGRWRHVALDAPSVGERLLDDGFLIDGSQLPGWRDPNEADLLLRPDLATAYVDPFAAQATLVVVCDLAEPATGLGYERCPRSTAARAEAWLARQSFADRVEVGVEIAFFIFDDVRYEASGGRLGFHALGSELPQAGAGAFLQGNPGHRPVTGAERLASPPADSTADIRAEITTILSSLGFRGIRHGHGAAPMQANFVLGPGGGLVAMADRLQIFKDVVHHVAASYGKTATFMPKPLADTAGAGLSIQESLWQGDRPAFAGQAYADLSDHALAFIAGILHHGRALNAFTNPSTNSYRRLRHGQEEPVLLAYAAYNRSAAVRIPFTRLASCKAVEVRFPDPLANPYLAFTAVLMAGLDGIGTSREPGDAIDRNLYDLPVHELEDLPAVAGSLGLALEALAADREFLGRGDVVSGELIDAYLAVKRAEIERVAGAPHPREFELYFGA